MSKSEKHPEYHLERTSRNAWQRISKRKHGHHYLDYGDVCWFCGEYNDDSVISNAVIDAKAEYARSEEEKADAEVVLGKYLYYLLEFEYSDKKVAVVPMPASQKKGTSGYDERIKTVCEYACVQKPHKWQVCDVLVTMVGSAPTHQQQDVRSDVAINNKTGVFVGYGLDKADVVLVVDDIVSSGAHFKTAQRYIQGAYGVKAQGAFFVRTPRRHKPLTRRRMDGAGVSEVYEPVQISEPEVFGKRRGLISRIVEKILKRK